MAYIGFRLDNANGFGGYVLIDGQNETKITDGLVLRVSRGMHSIKITSNSSLLKAGKLMANLFTDGAVGNSEADEYATTEDFKDNTLLTIDIITDSYGKMSYAPQSTKIDLNQEQFEEIENQLLAVEEQEQKMQEKADEETKKKASPKTFLIYMLLSILTFPTVIVPLGLGIAGYVKEIKFKRAFGYKPKFSTLQFLVSMIATLGGIVLISKFAL